MSDTIRKYRAKRQKRLDGRYGERVDSVEEFKKRRNKRLSDRGFRMDYGQTDITEPDAWITVRGNHIPVDENGRPLGGQKKALGRGGKDKGKKSELSNSGNSNSGGSIERSVYGKVSPEGYVGGWKPPKVKGMSTAKVNEMLSGCKKIGGKHYDRGTEVARDKRNTHLWTYTSHGLDHVQQVIEKTNQAADAIEMLPENSTFRGAKIDRPTLLVASWFHDTGMDGDDVKWGEMEIEKKGGRKVIGDDGEELRKAHGVNSAIHVLEHADEIRALGVDPNKVAMIAFAHTKSRSGVDNLGNPEEWKDALDKLESEIKKHNELIGAKPVDEKTRDTGDAPPEVKFDRSAVFGGEPSFDNIGEMLSSVAAIRLGDANREAYGMPLRSQSGGEYKVEVRSPKYFGSADEEASAATVSITEDGEKHYLDDKDEKMRKVSGRQYSKKVVLGEQNLAKIDTAFSPEHGTLQLNVTLDNGMAVPWCTSEVLLERCGELNTVNGTPRAMKIKMTGVESWDALGKDRQDAYKDMWRRILSDTADKKLKDGTVIKVPKYAGVENLVLEFENGEHRASAHDFEPVNRNNNRRSAK